ncbi:MAG: transglutaminase family protein [Anaerolineales bacterium]|nr:transglutaminase family protein [Anaerolineales bacterium]
MHLRIAHTTTFTYDHLISEAYTEMRLRPLDAGGQRCLGFSLATEPRDEVLQYTDRFGNDVRHFDFIQPHQTVRVSAVSEVLTVDRLPLEPLALSPLDEFDYRMATEYVPLTEPLARFAAAHAVPGDAPATVWACLHALYGRLAYTKGATDVTTTADEALALGQGVCQDFAHILLAVYRSLGLPARYVSGYLYNHGRDAASHAWVDVYLPGQGWLSLDPTHNGEQTDHYVRVAVGRDYADVPPTRGVFTGNAHETLAVEVTVTAL